MCVFKVDAPSEPLVRWSDAAATLAAYGGALNSDESGGSNCGKCRRATKGGGKIQAVKLAHTIHFWYIYSTCIEIIKINQNVGNHMDIYQIHGDLVYLPV